MRSGRSSIERSLFGRMPDGAAVERYTLRHSGGRTVCISTYGSTLLSLTAPDRLGRWADVLLGYERLADYREGRAYMGALIGRYANRIALGEFRLAEALCGASCNEGRNTLHGGSRGFDKVLWTVEDAVVQADEPCLTLCYESADGEEGFPGRLTVRAAYSLTAAGALRVDFSAWADRDTIINLTLHPYFNLRGSGDVLGHRLWLAGREYLPVDGALIPTGERRSVAATPFDFRSPRTIGARIGESDPQIRAAGGYDPTWVLADKRGMLKLDARVEEPETGRVLELLSTQPGLQFYAGQRLDGSVAGKGGQRYGPHSGFALEPQHFPDSPHHPAFPSTLLRAGDCYRHCIAYRFSILPVRRP